LYIADHHHGPARQACSEIRGAAQSHRALIDEPDAPARTALVGASGWYCVSSYNQIMKSPAVLLVQLGTPDEPTPKALRRYLRQFLSDPRVIEAPRLLWWFILNLFILPRRPAQSAAKYQRIWHPQTGSPLLHITKHQTERLQQRFPHVLVRFGMQ